MCGICGFYADQRERPNQDAVLEMFSQTEDRGKDASGFAAAVKGTLWSCRAPMPSSRLVSAVRDFKMDEARSWIGHCRLATQGSEKDNKNNHPFVRHGLALIHNGMVTNYHELYAKIGGEGLVGDCDSELILATILKYRSRLGVTRAIQQMAREIDGSMACAMINRRGEMWLWRRDEAWGRYAWTPLRIAVSRGTANVHFASTRKCLDLSLSPRLDWDKADLKTAQGVPFYLNSGNLKMRQFTLPACENSSPYNYHNAWECGDTSTSYRPLWCKECSSSYLTLVCKCCAMEKEEDKYDLA